MQRNAQVVFCPTCIMHQLYAPSPLARPLRQPPSVSPLMMVCFPFCRQRPFRVSLECSCYPTAREIVSNDAAVVGDQGPSRLALPMDIVMMLPSHLCIQINVIWINSVSMFVSLAY